MEYPDGFSIHPNLRQMSHSSNTTLHRCPRKYELEKLKPRVSAWGQVDLDFGSCVGTGIQEYLVTRDLNKAYMKLLALWQGDLDGDDDSWEDKKKTFWHALHAVDTFRGVAATAFGNMEVAVLNGRPATELGFSIDCGDGFTYRGFVDAVMLDTVRKILVVLECKTTRNAKVDEAVYKNSGQALGYSLILDMVAKSLGQEIDSSYQVFYPIYKTSAFSWEVMPFTKSRTSRALWIRQLLLDKQHISEYAEGGFFPMYGESCYDFFRQCEHFGTCEMSNKYIIGKEPPVREEKAGKYDFHFLLDDIIQQQLELLENEG